MDPVTLWFMRRWLPVFTPWAKKCGKLFIKRGKLSHNNAAIGENDIGWNIVCTAFILYANATTGYDKYSHWFGTMFLCSNLARTLHGAANLHWSIIWWIIPWMPMRLHGRPVEGGKIPKCLLLVGFGVVYHFKEIKICFCSCFCFYCTKWDE